MSCHVFFFSLPGPGFLLGKVPELANLGTLFKSSHPMEVTESETEYYIQCVKHTFSNYVVFQVGLYSARMLLYDDNVVCLSRMPLFWLLFLLKENFPTYFLFSQILSVCALIKFGTYQDYAHCSTSIFFFNITFLKSSKHFVSQVPFPQLVMSINSLWLIPNDSLAM